MSSVGPLAVVVDVGAMLGSVIALHATAWFFIDGL
jgi:hypothetical protein